MLAPSQWLVVCWIVCLRAGTLWVGVFFIIVIRIQRGKKQKVTAGLEMNPGHLVQMPDALTTKPQHPM